MISIANALWALGLGMQITLFVLMVQRKLLRPLPLFALLLAFYSVRSVLQFALPHTLSRESYGVMYSAFSVADLLLQVALAMSLVFSARTPRNLSVVQRMLGCIALILLSVSLTAGITALLPVHSPVPADRGSIFTGILFVIMFLVAAAFRIRSVQAVVLAGMALVGAAGTLAQVGKALAAAHRDAHAFTA